MVVGSVVPLDMLNFFHNISFHKKRVLLHICRRVRLNAIHDVALRVSQVNEHTFRAALLLAIFFHEIFVG